MLLDKVCVILVASTEMPRFASCALYIMLQNSKKYGAICHHACIRHALDMLSSEKITGLFLLNTSAYETEVVSSLRNFFSNNLAYDKNGLEVVKTS